MSYWMREINGQNGARLIQHFCNCNKSSAMPKTILVWLSPFLAAQMLRILKNNLNKLSRKKQCNILYIEHNEDYALLSKMCMIYFKCLIPSESNRIIKYCTTYHSSKQNIVFYTVLAITRTRCNGTAHSCLRDAKIISISIPMRFNCSQWAKLSIGLKPVSSAFARLIWMCCMKAVS